MDIYTVMQILIAAIARGAAIVFFAATENGVRVAEEHAA
jgi:hypothetical protein